MATAKNTGFNPIFGITPSVAANLIKIEGNRLTRAQGAVSWLSSLDRA